MVRVHRASLPPSLMTMYPYSMRCSDLTMTPDYRFSRSGLKGDYQLLGAVHYDHAVDVCLVHELHPAAEEDPSCA